MSLAFHIYKHQKLTRVSGNCTFKSPICAWLVGAVDSEYSCSSSLTTGLSTVIPFREEPEMVDDIRLNKRLVREARFSSLRSSSSKLLFETLFDEEGGGVALVSLWRRLNCLQLLSDDDLGKAP